METKTPSGEVTCELAGLINCITEAFWKGVLHQEQKQEHGSRRYAIPEIRTAIACAVAEIVGSGCYATYDDPKDELTAFIEEVRTAFEAIMSSDE